FDLLLAGPSGLLGSVNAVLKSMNALLGGLALVVLYALARELLGRRRAAWAVAVYAVMPASVNRHVWSHSLGVVLMLAALWLVVRARRERPGLPLAVLVGGLLLCAPTTALVTLALVAGALPASTMSSRRRVAAMAAAGVGLSLVWYGPAAWRYGMNPSALK